MPHQCLNCHSVFENTSDVIMKGCPNCHRKLFLFINKVPEKEIDIELSKAEKELVLAEIDSMIDVEALDKPIFLKLENVKIISSGKYEIDINQLMKKEKPLIYKVQEGTYIIDLNFLRNT